MENIIKSNNIELKTRTKGAELFSIKVDNIEFMWNKKEIWAKSSPILFPFVGALKDNKYIYKGKEYILEEKHGFARESEFELLEKIDNKLSYILSSNEKTKKVYPFDFNFIVSYEIKENNEVIMKFSVENKGDETMYFSLGTHPAFLIEGDYNNSYIEIDKKQDIDSFRLKGPLLDYNNSINIVKNSNKIEISDELFEIDTIIFKGDIIEKSILATKNLSRKITVEHKGFPYIAYWRPKKSSFLCIESWYGIPDLFDSNYILEEKKGIQKLEKGKIFEAYVTFKFEK